MKLRLLLIIMCLAICVIPIAMITGLQGFEIAGIFLLLILGITLVVGYGISYFISWPLVKLTHTIDEISKGNLDVELEKSEIEEINNLTTSLNRVMASLKLAIHKVGLKKEEIFEEVVKAKEDAENKLKNILNKIDGWIWEVDEKGRCTLCSEKVAEVIGFTSEQMTAKQIFEFLPSEEAEKLKKLISEMSKKRTDEMEKMDFLWLSQNDGHPVWIRTCFMPIFDNTGTFQGLRCFSRDVTEYRISQETILRLQEKIQQLEKMVDKTINEPQIDKPLSEFHHEKETMQDFDYMFLFDETGRIIDCTNEIQGKLGYNKEEVMLLTLGDIAYLESYEDLKINLDTVKRNGTVILKTIHKKKDGSSLFVREQIRFLKDRNLFICLVKQDIQ